MVATRMRRVSAWPTPVRVKADIRSDPAKPVDWSNGWRWRKAATEQYRALLMEIEPYLRSIARRCLKHPAGREDAVQDVLLNG